MYFTSLTILSYAMLYFILFFNVIFNQAKMLMF